MENTGDTEFQFSLSLFCPAEFLKSPKYTRLQSLEPQTTIHLSFYTSKSH